MSLFRHLGVGICTPQQYLSAAKSGRPLSRVSYSLLEIGEHPLKEQLRIFEELSFIVRTSNGTYRTTFRNRFGDVDLATLAILNSIFSSETELVVEDRAVSHGLTSLEWAGSIFKHFPNARFEASDKLLYLLELSLGHGEKYLFEPEGPPVQYINPPFVVGLHHKESSPICQIIARYAKRRLEKLLLPRDWMRLSQINKYKVSRVHCVHPEVLSFAKTDGRFEVRSRSIFEVLPAKVHVLRTMNILNKAYFSDIQLLKGVQAAYQTVRVGGLWIVGRTLEKDYSNHVTVFQKTKHGWNVVHRIGEGSEIEEVTKRTAMNP